MTATQQREVVKFPPNVPVEVALKFGGPGKVIATAAGDRVLFSLADDRVMFLDSGVAQKIEHLAVNAREKFFICRRAGAKRRPEWTVWLSPETEKARAEAENGQVLNEETPAESESVLERQLRESLELVKAGKLGEARNNTFVVAPGASAGKPAVPVQADASRGHQTSHNGKATKSNDGNVNGTPKQSATAGQTAWTQSLLNHTTALVDVYAAALSDASTKHGNQVKPEDVRSLLVTVFIQRSRGGRHAY
jgi:hypothetical protein